MPSLCQQNEYGTHAHMNLHTHTMLMNENCVGKRQKATVNLTPSHQLNVKGLSPPHFPRCPLLFNHSLFLPPLPSLPPTGRHTDVSLLALLL